MKFRGYVAFPKSSWLIKVMFRPLNALNCLTPSEISWSWTRKLELCHYLCLPSWAALLALSFSICSIKVNTSFCPASDSSWITWGPRECMHRNVIRGSLPCLGLPYLPFTADCLQEYFCDLNWQTFSFSWIIQWARLFMLAGTAKQKPTTPTNKLTFHFLFQHFQHWATDK